MEEKIIIELSKDEFGMILDKLSWLGCIVKNSDLDYERYCNGECDRCRRTDLGFKKWFESKIVRR